MKKGLFVAALSCSAVTLFGCKGASKVPTKITVAGAEYVVASAKDAEKPYTYKYVVNVKGSDKVDKSVTWSVDKTDIATIDDNGVLTPKAASGTVTITATSKLDEKIKGTFDVNVAAQEIKDSTTFISARAEGQKYLVDELGKGALEGTCQEGDFVIDDSGEEKTITGVSQYLDKETKTPYLKCAFEGGDISFSNLLDKDIEGLNELVKYAKEEGVDCDLRFFNFLEGEEATSNKDPDPNRLGMYVYHGALKYEEEELPEELEYFVFDVEDGCQTRHISYRDGAVTANVHATFAK